MAPLAAAPPRGVPAVTFVKTVALAVPSPRCPPLQVVVVAGPRVGPTAAKGVVALLLDLEKRQDRFFDCIDRYKHRFSAYKKLKSFVKVMIKAGEICTVSTMPNRVNALLHVQRAAGANRKILPLRKALARCYQQTSDHHRQTTTMQMMQTYAPVQTRRR